MGFAPAEKIKQSIGLRLDPHVACERARPKSGRFANSELHASLSSQLNPAFIADQEWGSIQ
jgi:hypothetical protein